MRALIKFYIALFFVTNCYAEEPYFNALRVAHAGGGISGKTYTNSYEALDLNIKKGFSYFEVDFSFTKDNSLVCIHDWKDSFKRSFGFNANERPTLHTFEFLARNASEFNKCTLDGLAAWMKDNPEATLVTDVKENNLKALRIISKVIPNAQKRVIPQIYQPRNYNAVKKMGYESIIWTLYKFRGSNDQIMTLVDSFNGSFAITMPASRAFTKLPVKLASKNIPTYVHTINDREKMDMFITQQKVTEIYTDFLNPLPVR